MLLNGLMLVVDRAVSELGDPLVRRYHDPLRLGSLREDVRYMPGLKLVYEHFSFTHLNGRWLPGGFLPLLWPGPGTMANHFYDKAVAEARSGRMAAAFVQLGRAAHILADMACPVHVNRVIHETDTYEWYIEAHVSQLAALPLPPAPAAKRPADLVQSLSSATRSLAAPDMTHNLIGRLLRRWGLRSPIPRAEIARQAQAVIPTAAAHMKALLQLFLADALAARV